MNELTVPWRQISVDERTTNMNKIKYQSLQCQKIAKIGASMKLKTILTAASIAVGLFAGSPAEAAAEKFHSLEVSIDDSGALVVAWDQRGLGEGPIDYVLTADAEAVYACVNKGGKNPEAANKESVESEVGDMDSVETKGGRAVSSLEAGPPESTLQCPKGQRFEFVEVTYSNIVFTFDGNEVDLPGPDPLTRTFSDVEV
jgi:hypothetical protein